MGASTVTPPAVNAEVERPLAMVSDFRLSAVDESSCSTGTAAPPLSVTARPVPSIVSASVIVGSTEARTMVPLKAKPMVSAPTPALAALMAWRRVQVLPHAAPSVSALLVTVNVAACTAPKPSQSASVAQTVVSVFIFLQSSWEPR